MNINSIKPLELQVKHSACDQEFKSNLLNVYKYT